jgi:hypothetical protein
MNEFRILNLIYKYINNIKGSNVPWWRDLTSPPAIEETGAMGREIESRQGIGW